MFRTADGRNFAVPFVLITSLFLLWGFCNGMIDILNKHFQDTLRINKEQSGLVQAANYLAYFLMAIPAGLIAKRFGYKGGILVGLTLIAGGAFLPILTRRYSGRPKAGQRASTSPRRRMAWAGFWGRSSVGILFFRELMEQAPMLVLPLPTSALAYLWFCY
jgi:MFS family permease